MKIIIDFDLNDYINQNAKDDTNSVDDTCFNDYIAYKIEQEITKQIKKFIATNTNVEKSFNKLLSENANLITQEVSNNDAFREKLKTMFEHAIHSYAHTHAYRVIRPKISEGDVK